MTFNIFSPFYGFKKMATNTIGIGKSLIDKNLHDFVNNEIIPGTNIDPNTFWKDFVQSANQLASKNKILLDKRDELQKKN